MQTKTAPKVKYLRVLFVIRQDPVEWLERGSDRLAIAVPYFEPIEVKPDLLKNMAAVLHAK
jgi:hypothetical protein